MICCVSHFFFFFFLVSVSVEREDAKGAKTLKKLDDANIAKELAALLGNVGTVVNKLKNSEKKVGAQSFAWKMIRQPCVWRVSIPSKVLEVRQQKSFIFFPFFFFFLFVLVFDMLS